MMNSNEVKCTNFGICLTCEKTNKNVEPDAWEYECQHCGKHTVFGTYEALGILS